MNFAQTTLLVKRHGVRLHREDFVLEAETDNWRKLHPTGPVHVKLTCRNCGEMLADDLREFGWLGNDSFWQERMVPHLAQCAFA